MSKDSAVMVALRTINGNYVTAVNGGGMGEAANKLPVHTDASRVSTWEQWRITFGSDGYCTIQAPSGNYLTAVNGGGVSAMPGHPVATDRTAPNEWEMFMMDEVSPGVYSLQTWNGRWMNAINGGGMGEAANKLPLHTDAGRAQAWEKFIIVPCKEHSKK